MLMLFHTLPRTLDLLLLIIVVFYCSLYPIIIIFLLLLQCSIVIFKHADANVDGSTISQLGNFTALKQN